MAKLETVSDGATARRPVLLTFAHKRRPEDPPKPALFAAYVVCACMPAYACMRTCVCLSVHAPLRASGHARRLTPALPPLSPRVVGVIPPVTISHAVTKVTDDLKHEATSVFLGTSPLGLVFKVRGLHACGVCAHIPLCPGACGAPSP